MSAGESLAIARLQAAHDVQVAVPLAPLGGKIPTAALAEGRWVRRGPCVQVCVQAPRAKVRNTASILVCGRLLHPASK